MSATVIDVKNLGKSFKLFHSNKDRLLNILPFVNKNFDRHISLHDISFEVKKGEFVSIIGKNGSGKSTLLKILCGVLSPTGGEYKVNGSIVSLLELGTGFSSELSGRENILVSAKTMNFDMAYVLSKMSQIEDFAELEEYFDMPIKTYSSGMYVRLAMSLFLHLSPDIFIIDEALSVGDIFFQQKCFAKIEEMRQNGVAFLFVSHDLGTVQKVSDRVLYLEHGRQMYFGDKNRACKMYYEDHIKHDLPLSQQKHITLPDGSDSPLANIISIKITDENGNETTSVEMMKKLNFEFELFIDESVENPALNLLIHNKTGLLVSNVTNQLASRGNFSVKLEVFFTIEAGEYSFDLIIGNRVSSGYGIRLFEHTRAGVITILFEYTKKNAPFYGLTYIKNNFTESVNA